MASGQSSLTGPQGTHGPWGPSQYMVHSFREQDCETCDPRAVAPPGDIGYVWRRQGGVLPASGGWRPEMLLAVPGHRTAHHAGGARGKPRPQNALVSVKGLGIYLC